MKLEFTKEQHAEFIKNHFQVITGHVLDENNELYYILPTKEEYTKDDHMIAKIQAEKFGFKVNNSYLVEDYTPENKTFCANYERDNYPEKPNSSTDNISTTIYNFPKIDGKYLYVIGIDPFEESEQDEIIKKVRQKLLDRSIVGYRKYKTTIWDNTDENYMLHLQDELLDGANYCEQMMRLGRFSAKVAEILESEHNNMSAGELIRKEYTNLFKK
jgi:hypothetical protein